VAVQVAAQPQSRRPSTVTWTHLTPRQMSD